MGERGSVDLNYRPFGTSSQWKRGSHPGGGRRCLGRSRSEHHLYESSDHFSNTMGEGENKKPGAPFASWPMTSSSFAMMIPVPEPSSRTVKGFGASSASRSGHGPGSEELGRPLLFRLKFESTRSVDKDRRRRCGRRAENGLGGSNSIQGSLDSRYVTRVYAASLGYSDDKFGFRDGLQGRSSPNSTRDAVFLNGRLLGVGTENLKIPEAVFGWVYLQVGREIWITHCR